MYYAPQIRESEPFLLDGGKDFVHEIVYITNNNGLRVVFLDDNRPPKIIAARKLKGR